MKKEIRDGLLLTGALASCIAAVLFLLDTASPANSGWQFDNAGLVAFVLGLVAIGIAVILDITDYILDQRPWASAPDYRRLKNKTVKFLREFIIYSDNDLPHIDESVRVSERQMFIMRAEELGIDQGKAEYDFDFEIMGRVWDR